MVKIYQYRGFYIQTAFLDGEFDCLRNTFEFTMHIAGKDKHVDDIKHLIQGIKERFHAVRSTQHAAGSPTS